MKMGGPLKPSRVAKGVAQGVSDKPGLKRVVCAFDEETFDQVRARAIAQNTSFAEQVRQLVDWGLEA